MGSVSKNNCSCCGAVGVHKSCLTPRLEAPCCNAILLEVTSLPCWLPLQTSWHHPDRQRALYNSHVCSQVYLLPKDIKMPPKAPATGALCCVGAVCFNLVIATCLRKAVPWQLGLDGWLSSSQHQRAAFQGTWVSAEQDKMTRNVLSGGNKMRT